MAQLLDEAGNPLFDDFGNPLYDAGTSPSPAVTQPPRVTSAASRGGMTFLQLCQRAAVECGVASSVAINTALPTVFGATGSLGRIVGWINDGWTDIQMDHDDWSWMRASNLLGSGIEFPTTAGQASYPLGDDLEPVFGKWDRGTFRVFPTAAGFRAETYLTDIPFDTWRDSYMYGAMRMVQTRPVAIAVGPDNSLNLGPPPNSDYTITGDYFVAPSTMVNDFDVPVGLPARFHMLIVYRAMCKYGRYEAASEVYERGMEENAGMYAQLQALRAPRVSFSGALA